MLTCYLCPNSFIPSGWPLFLEPLLLLQLKDESKSFFWRNQAQYLVLFTGPISHH